MPSFRIRLALQHISYPLEPDVQPEIYFWPAMTLLCDHAARVRTTRVTPPSVPVFPLRAALGEGRYKEVMRLAGITHVRSSMR
jgi:hypothetical protein